MATKQGVARGEQNPSGPFIPRKRVPPRRRTPPLGGYNKSGPFVPRKRVPPGRRNPQLPNRNKSGPFIPTKKKLPNRPITPKTPYRELAQRYSGVKGRGHTWQEVKEAKSSGTGRGQVLAHRAVKRRLRRFSKQSPERVERFIENRGGTKSQVSSGKKVFSQEWARNFLARQKVKNRISPENLQKLTNKVQLKNANGREPIDQAALKRRITKMGTSSKPPGPKYMRQKKE